MIEDEVDEFLEHFGIKGMRWGVRKERSSSNEPKPPLDKKALVKKVAIGVGVIAVAVGAAYAAKSISQSGNVPVSSLSSATIDRGKKAVVAIEPTSILHSTRGRNKGFTFLKTGGTPTPLAEYDAAGFSVGSSGDYFRRYGNANEKVASRFADPNGRKDRAGRPIFHEVIVPPSMSNDINSVKDVVDKIWPMVKDDYDAFYD